MATTAQMTGLAHGQLPDWFARPSPDPCQCSLFTVLTVPLDEVLTAHSVSRDELSRWHDRGWVSFVPNEVDGLEQPQVNEICFVRDIVRSGLNDACINALLNQLPKPMNWDPTRVAYSFTLGWVEAVEPPEAVAPEPSDVIDEHLDAWLAETADSDLERLKDLRDQIAALIEERE